MKDGLTYEHFYFIIKTSIKLVGFIYLFIYLLIYMTLLSNHFYPGFSLAQIIVQLLLQILVDAAAGYDLPPSQSFYFLLWASRRLYCHNNNPLIITYRDLKSAMDRSSDENVSKIKQWHDPFLLVICRLITSVPSHMFGRSYRFFLVIEV